MRSKCLAEQILGLEPRDMSWSSALKRNMLTWKLARWRAEMKKKIVLVKDKNQI